jgi:hypothetical protein
MLPEPKGDPRQREESLLKSLRLRANSATLHVRTEVLEDMHRARSPEPVGGAERG